MKNVLFMGRVGAVGADTFITWIFLLDCYYHCFYYIVIIIIFAHVHLFSVYNKDGFKKKILMVIF